MDNNERFNPSDDGVSEGFDQTNDLAGDQLGESDGTLEGSLRSGAEREGGEGSLLDGDDEAGDDEIPTRSADDGGLPGNPTWSPTGGL